MTSNRLYAVAALALSACLPLGACSQADSPEGETKPTASTPAYAPALTLDVEQARRVATLGQTAADTQISDPVQAGVPTSEECEDLTPINPAEGRSWLGHTEVLEGGPPGMEFRDQVRSLSSTWNAVVVLDDSPSAGRLLDEQINQFPTCQRGSAPKTPFSLAVPGASSTSGYFLSFPKAHRSQRFIANSYARVGNVFLHCNAGGTTQKAVTTNVIGCVTAMAAGIPLARRPGSDQVSTKLRLAGLRDSTHDVVQTGAYSTPCPKNNKDFFIPQGSPAVMYTDKPQGDATFAQTLGWVATERLRTPAAAKAKVAGLRKSMASCVGKFTSRLGASRTSGTVKPLASLPAGDGGLAITHDVLFEGNSKPETAYDAVFSTGPYVVHIYGATPTVAQGVAPQIVKVLGATP